MGDDGLHPNAKGYRVMAPLAAAAIQKAVGAQRPVARLLRRAEAAKSISAGTKPKRALIRVYYRNGIASEVELNEEGKWPESPPPRWTDV